MSNDEPTARITLTTVFNQVQELTNTVTTLTERLPAHTEATDQKLADHERRLRSLETRMWAFVGAFGLIAAVSPYLSRLFIP
jgi:hypothetical protein